MTDFERLRTMSDAEVKSIWKAITELTPFDDQPDVEWCEDVYSELSARGISGYPSNW